VLATARYQRRPQKSIESSLCNQQTVGLST
jgi:hypothetical protein